MSEEKRKYFKFFRSFYEAALEMEDADQAAYFRAICAYALDGKKPRLKGVPAAMFRLVQPVLDCSVKRAEAGAAGGRKTQEALRFASSNAASSAWSSASRDIKEEGIKGEREKGYMDFGNREKAKLPSQAGQVARMRRYVEEFRAEKEAK